MTLHTSDDLGRAWWCCTLLASSVQRRMYSTPDLQHAHSILRSQHPSKNLMSLAAHFASRRVLTKVVLHAPHMAAGGAQIQPCTMRHGTEQWHVQGVTAQLHCTCRCTCKGVRLLSGPSP